MVVKSCYLARTIESEEVLKEYTEKLNCKIRHKLTPNEGFCVYVMEDVTGNQFVLILIREEPYKSQLRNFVGTRVVIDNIQEGMEFFKNDGYEVIYGPFETESNFACTMKKGDEFKILFEHKHNH